MLCYWWMYCGGVCIGLLVCGSVYVVLWILCWFVVWVDDWVVGCGVYWNFYGWCWCCLVGDVFCVRVDGCLWCSCLFGGIVSVFFCWVIWGIGLGGMVFKVEMVIFDCSDFVKFVGWWVE